MKKITEVGRTREEWRKIQWDEEEVMELLASTGSGLTNLHLFGVSENLQRPPYCSKEHLSRD